MDAFPPARHHEPLKVAEDTYLIRQLDGEGTAPLAAYINSLVILGHDPIIVDTGASNNRQDWLNDVFSLVQPEAVRWVFLSHDDVDHTGNLRQVLEMCPNATLITNWFTVLRIGCELALPPERMRWIDDGGTFEANGRTYAAIRPPLYDSPTTRGLYDPRTGVYWASDCFSAPVVQPADNIAELPAEFWHEGFFMFQRALSPWHNLLDQAKFDAQIKRVACLDVEVLATGHGPVTTNGQVAESFKLMQQLPSMADVVLPGQAELDAMVAAMSQIPEPA